MECGPTMVGDGDSDPQLMALLEANLMKQLGNEFQVQSATLVKLAAGVFVAGSTGLYLAQKSVQWKVRKLPHYSESLKIVYEHPKAIEAIGAPIQIGTVELADRRHNYVDKTRSQLRIPITGVVDCGHMDVLAVRDAENDEFQTAKVRLSLNGGVFTIYDTGKWEDNGADDE
ncbi:unnamed protein product [Caenorhabditis bovis]|uniref:Uncharacterized protein n=1 Tax=Caenorhabditis bovis TaxID=2654633 RepID=A0A8S1F2C7_9PELO|nr:unnamed protein product [Caenorhabditis bovis]